MPRTGPAATSLASLQAVRTRGRAPPSRWPPSWTGESRELEHVLATEPFVFNRKFLFRALSMGHSQFAELIGARGPNTQVNSACASTTHGACAGRGLDPGRPATGVIVVAADDVTNDVLLPWVGAGFLASGAAATDDSVEDAAIPFDRRRHGMIVGMGAAAFVVESADAARERGIQPICEVLGARSPTARSTAHAWTSRTSAR